MESSLPKIIIGGALILGLGFFGYILFFAPVTAPAVSTDQDAQNILDLASQLNTVVINPGLFASPIFTSLKDFTPTITPELQGRPDPFINIGNEDYGFNAPVVKPKH